ncbi:hypothetical protein QN362_04405 [Actimicrobium sp. CCC2.4]|uniref:hypothetical protein n=1 Tax=Actimicrobium sp. CCC2.4 TaxID=3048606 RepID=UPI002AC8D7EE|nr:hypothetical protein [Actimicrobium sp. CCC2.4]MEB0134568.1 hypothetical protein [Actimicrobium sp. CCC2.4]WPX34010.1 hypothetical protein RHM62_09485 [Actimicrobium sp. CCC2.4]
MRSSILSRQAMAILTQREQVYAAAKMHTPELAQMPKFISYNYAIKTIFNPHDVKS